MNRKFELVVLGEPVAQGRPRFSNRTGFTRAYDPKKSADQKTLIGVMAREKMEGQPLLSGPLSLTLRVYCHYPKSWSKKKIEPILNGIPIFKETKSDLDNYIKLVLDACNTIVFADDSAVAVIRAEKYWSDKDSTDICIEELN